MRPNQKCPCGSGKKFKKCCMWKGCANPEPPPPPAQPEQDEIQVYQGEKLVRSVKVSAALAGILAIVGPYMGDIERAERYLGIRGARR